MYKMDSCEQKSTKPPPLQPDSGVMVSFMWAWTARQSIILHRGECDCCSAQIRAKHLHEQTVSAGTSSLGAQKLFLLLSWGMGTRRRIQDWLVGTTRSSCGPMPLGKKGIMNMLYTEAK